MGFYSQYILPKLLDQILSKPYIELHRKDILAEVEGDILEIGFGTGMNLPYYPKSIKKITVIDVNEGMNALAKSRIEASPIEVDFRIIDAGRLPFEEHIFDSVVSTFTFCSIENINDALKEFRRVLRPHGKLFFLEHGLSPHKNIRRAQHVLNPIYKPFSGGCNLDRDIKKIVENNHFQIIELDQFYEERMLKIAGYLYKGIAVKA